MRKTEKGLFGISITAYAIMAILFLGKFFVVGFVFMGIGAFSAFILNTPKGEIERPLSDEDREELKRLIEEWFSED